jgi:molybdopterin-containing oxidoreductase family membrane subunit
MTPDPAEPAEPLVANNPTMPWPTASILEKKAPLGWSIAMAVTVPLALLCVLLLAYLVSTGVGVLGNNHPLAWAWDATNFLFWSSLANGGLLISAGLFLTRQKWRSSIHRAAEAMTLFALVCAGLYPVLSLGRVWMAWALVPVPNADGVWQNFRSPLLWNFFALASVFLVAGIIFFIGLLPDLATLRDRCPTKTRTFLYGLLALGWRGSNRQWRHYQMATLLLAGISLPLVLAAQAITSFSFATTLVPGWHTTLAPLSFVAEALCGALAMLLTLLIPARVLYRPLQDLVTKDTLQKLCKLLLLAASLVGYACLMEFFMAWYSSSPYDRSAFWYRAFGPYGWAFWASLVGVGLVPQLFWFQFCRSHPLGIWILVQFSTIGLWFQHFGKIASSLSRDFTPSTWGEFCPTWVDVCTFAGTFGLFGTLFLLFLRYLPMVSLFEIKALLPEADPRHGKVPPLL